MIRYELRGDAAWITLDRPEKLNALHVEGWHDLREALDRAAVEARVAVLAGAGDAFCAGDDIAAIADLETTDDVEALADGIYGGLFGVEAVEVPVVAAVDGVAYGGGFELTVAADLAVATEDATFAVPETRIGAYPPYVVARIAAIGGRKRLMELALTGDPIDAGTALEWGLLNRVVPESDLEVAVGEYVAAIAESPRGAVGLAKRYAHAAVTRGDEREHLRGGFSRVAGDEECLARARAFVER